MKKTERLEAIMTRIKARIEWTVDAIERCIRWWPEDYAKRGECAIQQARAVGERLLNFAAKLSRPEVNNIFIICFSDWRNREGLKAAAARLRRQKNHSELLMLVAAIHPYPFRLDLPTNSLWRCYENYYWYRRHGTIWRKKRKKIIQEHVRCEECGSTENLEVHHIMGLGSEKPEDLKLLCRDCHRIIEGRRPVHRSDDERKPL